MNRKHSLPLIGSLSRGSTLTIDYRALKTCASCCPAGAAAVRGETYDGSSDLICWAESAVGRQQLCAVSACSVLVRQTKKVVEFTIVMIMSIPANLP